jgi:hypothetical protein
LAVDVNGKRPAFAIIFLHQIDPSQSNPGFEGIQDFVVGERTRSPSIVWYKRTGKGWKKFVIDGTPLRPEAGGDFCDIDRDGDLDIVFGQDASGHRMWWWENPYPKYDKKWPRHQINSGGSQSHDQVFGDFDGDGRADVAVFDDGAGRWFVVLAQ